MRKRSRKVVGLGAFITLTFVFLIASGIFLYFFQDKVNEINEIDRYLQIERQKNEELRLQLEDTQKQNEQMNNQIEELKEQIKELQLKISNAQDTKVESQKVAYLTFDDGPSDNTVAILDFLKEHDVKATFFVIGNENRLDIYKRIVDEGHTLGNHTYGHDYNKIYRSPQAFFEDVEKLNDLLESVTGQRTKILRFPGGSNNTVSRRSGGKDIMKTITLEAKNRGYRYFDWNVDSQDASKVKQSKNIIVKSVVSGAQYNNQAVILMHDAPAKTTTVEALPEMIEGLKKQGFIFKGLTMDTPEVKFQ